MDLENIIKQLRALESEGARRELLQQVSQDLKREYKENAEKIDALQKQIQGFNEKIWKIKDIGSSVLEELKGQANYSDAVELISNNTPLFEDRDLREVNKLWTEKATQEHSGPIEKAWDTKNQKDFREALDYYKEHQGFYFAALCAYHLGDKEQTADLFVKWLKMEKDAYDGKIKSPDLLAMIDLQINLRLFDENSLPFLEIMKLDVSCQQFIQPFFELSVDHRNQDLYVWAAYQAAKKTGDYKSMIKAFGMYWDRREEIEKRTREAKRSFVMENKAVFFYEDDVTIKGPWENGSRTKNEETASNFFKEQLDMTEKAERYDWAVVWAKKLGDEKRYKANLENFVEKTKYQDYIDLNRKCDFMVLLGEEKHPKYESMRKEAKEMERHSINECLKYPG